MSADPVVRVGGVLFFRSKPHTSDRGPFFSAFTAAGAGNARRVHRNRPARVSYSDAESARAGEGERHE